MAHKEQTPFDDIAVTAINNAMLMEYSGILLFKEISESSQTIWAAGNHYAQPNSIQPKVNAPGIEVRYRLGNLLTKGASQVLDIAAGLTPRGLTMTTENQNCTYVELDLPIIIKMKKRICE